MECCINIEPISYKKDTLKLGDLLIKYIIILESALYISLLFMKIAFFIICFMKAKNLINI